MDQLPRRPRPNHCDYCGRDVPSECIPDSYAYVIDDDPTPYNICTECAYERSVEI